ncbi:hypothetical protein [Streptomyces sp. NPDC006691]|uniref:hypothetical protein n=1 Tax=Streptomyces sp. NPDC006691 TaxID=3364757 RepID=UPI0036C86FA3
MPLSRWSCRELAAELTARGITDNLSASTVRRRLAQDALIPWQRRSWIFVTDAASCGSWGQGRVGAVYVGVGGSALFVQPPSQGEAVVFGAAAG